MAYHQSTLQRAASCYGSVSILDGVQFKVGEKFKPPKKVTLPVGWHQNDPSDLLSLTYDFSLEKDVLAKCQAEKNAKEMESNRLKDQEMLMAAMTVSCSTTSSNSESALQQVNKPAAPMYANVSTDILTPITVASTNSTIGNADITRNCGFNIKDFEGEATTPFELVELQSINDMDALKSLLQPELQLTPTTNASPVPPVNLNTASSVSSEQLIDISHPASSGGPSNQRSNYCVDTGAMKYSSNLAHGTENVNSLGPQVVGVSSFSHGTPANTTPTVSYSTGQGTALISVGDNKPHFQPPPLSMSQLNHVILPGHQPGMLPGGPVSKPGQLPPLVQPGSGKLPALRTGPPQIPPRTYKKLVGTQNGGTHVQSIDVPPSTTSPPPFSLREPSPGLGAIRQSPEPIPRGYAPLTLGQETTIGNSCGHNSSDISGKRRTAERRTRLNSADGTRSQSSPLPPIHNASNDTIYHQMTPTSCLPDPYPTMSDPEKNFVSSIASMGFSNARVARAVLRLGLKDREVIDFLILVEEFSASGFSGDSIEVALVEYNTNKDKVLEFLKVASTLSELGFKEEDIFEALKKTDNDTDKALDYLMTK